MHKLDAHAALLADALNGIGPHFDDAGIVTDTIAYLQLCSGIKSVSFDTFDSDPMVGWCGPADAHRDRHDRMREALVHRLSVFLFAWAGLEAYAKTLTMPSAPKILGRKRRAVDSLCAFLSAGYHEPLPEKWLEAMTLFKTLAAASTIGRNAGNATALPSFVLPPAEGIYLVAELRNAFAHGDFSVPEPNGDYESAVKQNPDIMLVAVSTRVVLLTIQMLTLCVFPPDEIVELGWRCGMTKPLSVRAAFLTLHLERCKP